VRNIKVKNKIITVTVRILEVDWDCQPISGGGGRS